MVLNTDREEKSLRVDLSQYAKAGGSVKVIRTSGNFSSRSSEEWAELPDIESDTYGFTAELKENSITTYIVDVH